MTAYDGFRVETADGVATITLDVPRKLNRISMVARDELGRVFDEFGGDAAVRAVVLTGAGETFTAGGDIAGFLERSPEELSRLAWNVAAPERCPKPVVAALRGYVFGVGLELALACDFRLAADDVQLALPEVRLGMIPGSGGSQRALRLIGMTRAKLFMLTGQRVSAERAEAWGLITQAVADDGLDAAVQALADELASRPPLALRTLKMVLNRGAEAPLETALELERKAYAWLRSTHDYEEGVRAFLEKRTPEYRGR